MALFVKVIPPSSRARIHEGTCTHCNQGSGQEGQIIGDGPTYWRPAHPSDGYATRAEAQAFMDGLKYTDTGICAQCERRVLAHA